MKKNDATDNFALLVKLCEYRLFRWLLIKRLKGCFVESFRVKPQETLTLLLVSLVLSRHPAWSMQILELFLSVPNEYLEANESIVANFNVAPGDSVHDTILKMQSVLIRCFSIHSLKIDKPLIDSSDYAPNPFQGMSQTGQIESMTMADVYGEHEKTLGEWSDKHKISAMTMVVDKNYFFNLVKKEAEAGDLESQYILGLLYSDGYGTEQDADKAITWLRTAANKLHANAQCTIGYMTCLGLGGVAKNENEGWNWIEASAQNGNTVAKSAIKRYRK